MTSTAQRIDEITIAIRTLSFQLANIPLTDRAARAANWSAQNDLVNERRILMLVK